MPPPESALPAKNASVRVDNRSGGSFQPLRFALQPVIKQAAPKGVTGHYLQLLTLWPDLTRNTHASGSLLSRLSFPKGAQQGATLHLHARDSSQALCIAHDKAQLKTRINQAFGYGLISDIKVIATGARMVKQAAEKPADGAGQA